MMKIWLLVVIATVVASQPFDEEHQKDLNKLVTDSNAWNSFGSFVKKMWNFGSEPNVGPTLDGEGPFRLYSGQYQFALSMLNTLGKSNSKNVFFSPHSTYRALLLAYMGSNGKTMKSLEKAMFLDWAQDKTDVMSAYKSESAARARRFSDKSIQFKSVDKLYITNAAKLKSHIMDVFTKKQIELVDFSNSEERRAEINAFVAKVTQNHIKDLLAPSSIDSGTNVVLVNAAFFKGNWKTKFNQQLTQSKAFYGSSKKTVQMMAVRSKFNYGVLKKEGASFLEMPYIGEDESVSMLVFLPLKKSPTAVDDLLNKFSPDTIKQALTNGKLEDVDVEFPKMSLSEDYALPDAFEEMGIKHFFGTDSNFTDFTENVPIRFDDAIHKAVLEVDEEGSVAAAATAIFGMRSAHIQEQIEFHCDHPFIFLINDRISQEVLFAGVYRGK